AHDAYRRADGVCRVPGRDPPSAARLGRACVRHPPVDPYAARRPLRGAGGPGSACRGDPRLLPAAPAPVTAAWPRPLISPAGLAAHLDRPELRLIECGVAYHMLPDRSDFR